MTLQRVSKTCLLALLSAAMLFLASCNEKPAESSSCLNEIRLSEQYGLAYAPVAAARLNGWFEEELPDTEFKWLRVGNATAIREAILAGKLDGGFMGIPPYLIGRDKGMEWTAVSGISEALVGMAVVDEEPESLIDLDDSFRIALPQPGSLQHILLAMAAEKELGDAKAFDSRLVTMNHPDGMSALLAGGEINGHFTSPPYLQKELEAGARLLVNGNEAFGGDYTFIIAVLSDSLINTYPACTPGINRALARGARWLRDEPAEAASLLAEHFGMEEEELETFFRSDALNFGVDVKGLERFSGFMHQMGYLSKELPAASLLVQ